VVSLLELFLLTRDPAERYDGIRQVLTGGEPLSPELVRRLYARTTASLTNLYGPSECTIYCTAWECPRDPLPGTVLIGRAITGAQLWILDEAGEPVPSGRPGELYIGGAGLALGYLNRPEQTAERFLSGHPVRPDGRLYRSGDLVRRLPTGELEFLGRIDRQVKIRGIRVELGEIESTALRCPGVRQAAAVAYGSGRDKGLAVFLVPRGHGSPDELPTAVRGVLRANLPGYMVPTIVETTPDLPLTPSGKLDTAALQQRAERRSAPAQRELVEALTADATVDDVVSAVWREVLNVEALTPDADFFDNGGDSFTMLQAVRRSAEVLAVPIPPVTLLRAPTVALFSAAVRHMIEEEVSR
jgi:acyl-coenzyme A synthetase/AMP-(fatty) acid ligase